MLTILSDHRRSSMLNIFTSVFIFVAAPPHTDVNNISADINWTEEDEYMRTRYSHKNKGSSRSWAPSKSKGHESEGKRLAQKRRIFRARYSQRLH
jgi:hypothetical protein